MTTPDQFITNISQVNPSSNVNDENANLPIQELQNNFNFLLNLLTVSSGSTPNFYSLSYGNLLDYDDEGNKIFFNGGNMDCFEKKNSWLAVDDGAVENDTEIQNTGAADLLVYNGGVSYTDSAGEHGIWLQREFYIPPILRGSELIFAIKGTGVNLDPGQPVPFDYEIPYCNISGIPNISAVGLPACMSTSGTSGAATPGTSACIPDLSTGCYSRYEDIGIDIVGGLDVVQQIETIGPWPEHQFYALEPSWLPQYRTVSLSFRVGKNTDSITIRIRRTRPDGAIAISQMFLGGLPMPYLSYNIEHLDINELYDFNLGITKWNITTVNGRHVAQDATTSQLPNLLTKEQFIHLSQFNRNIDEFDWDALSGPRLTELAFSTSTGAPSSAPSLNVFAFDPEFVRSMYYDMRVDGPDPGLCSIGVSFFVNQDLFSDTITCAASGGDQLGICSYIKFNVSVSVVNTGLLGSTEFGTPQVFSYLVPIPAYTILGNMGYFEVYGDFYNQLVCSRGSIVYFTISRDGTDPNDTFEGNFLVVGVKTGIAVPPDDIPPTGSYPNLFVGDNTSC